MLVIRLLIIFFVVLILLQILLANFGISLVEGMENKSGSTSTTSSNTQYQSYPEDPLILAKQNAANIDFLKSRVDETMNLKQAITDISMNMNNMQTQLNTILEQQQEYANNINGGEPLTVEGADTGGEPESMIEEEAFTNYKDYTQIDKYSNNLLSSSYTIFK
jgi:hypothetical protein